MTYAEFVKSAQAGQAAYIREEKARMKKARRHWSRYVAAMGALGLHPLTGSEIGDRDRQLDQMRADIPTTHGDSPTMRFHYDRTQERKPLSPIETMHSGATRGIGE